MKLIESLQNILKNKNKVTYQDYKNVYNELEAKMFPDLHYKLTKEKIDGAQTYSDQVNYLEQIEILNKNFPEFNKKNTEEFIEFDKMIKERLYRWNKKYETN
ncbi:MAG: hypothetical protein IKP65_05495 [Alphaproteobacteria bacterium]|nr:hypothetical protein [Alphaproteobacteria bacterium]